MKLRVTKRGIGAPAGVPRAAGVILYKCELFRRTFARNGRSFIFHQVRKTSPEYREEMDEMKRRIITLLSLPLN